MPEPDSAATLASAEQREVPPPRALAATSAKTGVQPRYLRGFECLGGDCEDTCCAGWAIEISRRDHRRLRVILGDEELDRTTLRSKTADRPREDWRPGYATFKQDSRQRCCNLSTEGLCGLQSRHGTDGLTNVCHQYPRLQLKLDQRVERAGSLACPEIARRCLLEEDAMALERFAPDDDFTLSRPALVLRGKNDAMRTHFREVRDALIQAISQRDLHATDRLGVLLMLSNRMPKAFRAGGRVDPEELQRSLAFALDPALSAEVTPALAGIPPRGPAALTLVSFILCIFPASEGGRLADLINKLRQDCARLVELPLDSVSDALLSKAQFDALSAEYEARRDAAQSLFADRTDMYFTNYCINHLLCAPFLDQVNLRVYVEDLVVRVATLRFLFFSHPLVTAAVAQADRDAAEVTLDRAAVETFQAFAREVEHSRFYLARLRNLLVKAHAHTLGDFLCLTRF